MHYQQFLGFFSKKRSKNLQTPKNNLFVGTQQAAVSPHVIVIHSAFQVAVGSAFLSPPLGNVTLESTALPFTGHPAVVCPQT